MICLVGRRRRRRRRRKEAGTFVELQSLQLFVLVSCREERLINQREEREEQEQISNCVQPKARSEAAWPT